MNCWRWFVILACAISLGIIIATGFFPSSGFEFHSLMAGNTQEMPRGPFITVLDQNQKVISSISIFFSLAIIGILILFAVPKHIRQMTRWMPASFSPLLRLFLLGILGAVLGMAASFFSVLARITFPLAIILFAILFAASLMGMVAVAYAFGRGLINRAGWRGVSPVVPYLAGLLILYGPTCIPWLGPVLWLVFACLGLGAVMISKFGSGQSWNLNSLMEEEKDE